MFSRRRRGRSASARGYALGVAMGAADGLLVLGLEYAIRFGAFECRAFRRVSPRSSLLDRRASTPGSALCHGRTAARVPRLGRTTSTAPPARPVRTRPGPVPPPLGATAPANESGSGGDAVEAIADLLSIARLPPEHDPGAGYGVATAARQRWHLAIRNFGLFGGPLAAAND